MFAAWGLFFPYSHFVTTPSHRRSEKWIKYFRQLSFHEDVIGIFTDGDMIEEFGAAGPKKI